METLKHSCQAYVAYGMLSALGKVSEAIESIALDILSKKASLVISNLPGPKKAIFVCGAKLIHPMFTVPQVGEVGVGLSILSYQGEMFFGVIADKALLPQPNKLTKGFNASYQQVRSQLNLDH